ncbi:GbsR/MarR family transcriptional regulator [Singulisphaera sp. GP187]|uniref:GbsR/MarR family transcriptional regulator n=1 Tax=Singulisphaera sp. GP187 TaxID=1882752 RepID=UPI001C1F2E2C|nr:helix-turn-helix domain-containing protein [Singulisphaera sp. GP187]
MTDGDREQIAAGLKEQLTYAEIARRLARPTSTISREVTRNGGPDGYQADPAHRASKQRAHRSKWALPPTPPVGHRRDLRALHGFEEQCAALLVLSGLPRMTARVLACLVTTDGSLTAADLVQRLQVSPASISKAIGQLEEQKLARRERRPMQRHEEYTIDDEVWFQSWLASARINALLSDLAQQGADILGLDTPAGARLQDMAQFLDHVGRDMVQAAERWRKVLLERRTSDH